ncbi:GTP-binding protein BRASSINAZOLE INSENSITIVE PALE GREEN 2, chloroplastic [Magnolia sinica]|uniref:GTP-binding protein BRASSINAZOLE INSENSITIVE PALE GREEN 2, chloroplastic n=1 Tax=Magnolia sinica TaxID=86752 RepID=UPI00265B170D|nr:GTP-binding protein BRASSINAZOLE INSENSITIVE PALE GREEN 2, chloroplastic [Magnolia sinica]
MLSRMLSPSKLKHFIPLISSLHSPPKPLQTSFRPISSSPPTIPPSLPNPPPNFRSDGSIESIPSVASSDLPVCPGCGVYMQDSHPKLPGFFIRPSPKDPDYRIRVYRTPIADEPEISDSLKRGHLPEPELPPESSNNSSPEKPIVCARCHSLRHYGRVKDAAVENLLPDFDFDHTIGRRLASASGTRSVVLMVVDASDFDGSFPRRVAQLVSSTIDENSSAWKQGKSANVPRVVLVVTKIDLLPPSLSPTRLEHWVRQRAREGGASKLTSVHLVSAVRDWGLNNLVEDVRELAGARGNVWAIGAQNAGKSTLINSIGKHVGRKLTHLTEAPVPGTTLGIIRVEGILPGQAKLFDTPGILHPYQISTRLTREEQKLVHIGKELKPRTYRLKAGHSVHIAGLIRLDVEETSVDSIYVTVWASPYLPLHMGKMENAITMVEAHFGRQLQPPIGEKRVAELGKWVRREFSVSGNSWDASSVDVAAAGLGWFAVGLKGEAVLGVWTYDGVDVTLRSSLIPHRAQMFEVTGFTVSKIVSRADSSVNKQHSSRKEKKQSDSKETVSDEMVSDAASESAVSTDRGA